MASRDKSSWQGLKRFLESSLLREDQVNGILSRANACTAHGVFAKSRVPYIFGPGQESLSAEFLATCDQGICGRITDAIEAAGFGQNYEHVAQSVASGC
ncbi:hypothetical protein K8R03_01545 [Candidatus Kaiserbacteria bacterium]|nr:hypothetical protein [Candidatus Kaiserbacteria bacterium]